ncbi:MAG: hypothetical protein P8X74_06750 [Reinekea sp.]
MTIRRQKGYFIIRQHQQTPFEILSEFGRHDGGIATGELGDMYRNVGKGIYGTVDLASEEYQAGKIQKELSRGKESGPEKEIIIEGASRINGEGAEVKTYRCTYNF